MRFFLTCMMIGATWLCATSIHAQTVEIQNQIEKKLKQQRPEDAAIQSAVEMLLRRLFDNKGTLKIEIDDASKAQIEKAQIELRLVDKPKLEPKKLEPGGFRIEVQVGKTKAVTTQVKPGSIEDLRAEALKNNPDMRIAEAKLRLAEAEFDGTRRTILAKLDAALAEIEAAKASFAEAKVRFERAKDLHDKKVISNEELAAAALTLSRMRSEVAAMEARLPVLLGRPVSGAKEKK